MKLLSKGINEGINSFSEIGHSGPCLHESEEHRYFFRIYAVNTLLNLENRIERNQFLDTLQGHVLAKGELMGIYGR